jgi:hypothetical protein
MGCVRSASLRLAQRTHPGRETSNTSPARRARLAQRRERPDLTRRAYWYARLQRPSRLRRGDRVRSGERIDRIGATGNARTVGCQLHFELRVRGVPIDPEGELHACDGWS